jgi:transcriptional regulator with XRE-family HTH domain
MTDPTLARMLGDELRRARKSRGWTQPDLAAIVDISVPTLGTYELGTRSIGVQRFVQLCQVLEVSASDLLARSIQRAARAEHSDRLPVDLRLILRDERPDLAPLRRWALHRLSSVPDRGSTVVHFDLPAVMRLAELCGLSTPDLLVALRMLIEDQS